MNEELEKEVLETLKCNWYTYSNYHIISNIYNPIINSLILEAKQEERQKNISDIEWCILNSEDWEELINNLHLVFKINK